MSASPNSSPRSSPRPSPRPRPKKDHVKKDNHLTVNYKEQPASNYQKQDLSPGQESNKSSNLETATPDAKHAELGSSAVKEKKNGKSKKKAWYSALYPTYKSKSEDFKRIFKDVPDDERLIIDYSCALQKEILVHGRLYASQNCLCFYANIFGWETNVTFRWKEVCAITKEKTALVIPNAVLISTKTDKYFFTSFAARDKTYLMLFRIWQNALMDQSMTNQEMWQWVHQCYGDELGLTSDDDDYVNPSTEEEKCIPPVPIVESAPEECLSTGTVEAANVKQQETNLPQILSENHLQTDQSDTTESDIDKARYDNVICTSTHEGRLLVNEVIPMNIDTIFTLLFTSSKFFLDFHASRKTTDLTQTAWTYNSSSNTKTRVVNLTASLNASVGPKTAQVTETQVMLPCSKSGWLYAVDAESVNSGIPYADSFFILVHTCLRKVSDLQTSYTVHAQIKYKKSVWAVVRSFIEKNCYHGLDEFYNSVLKALLLESEEMVPAVKRKSRRRRRILSSQRQETDLDHVVASALTVTRKTSNPKVFSSDFATMLVFGVLILLVILNVMLYYKLWSLEEAAPSPPIINFEMIKNHPQTHEDWIKVLQKQESLHNIEMKRWQKVLKTSIQLLKQAEESLGELQHSIHPKYTNQILSMMQNHEEDVNKAHEL